MDWKTVPDEHHPLPKDWQTPLGEACPHGLSIFLVDGTFVRNTFDSDFDQGGNGYAYSWIPKSQIWIARETPGIELPFVVFHECLEVEHMKKGLSYDKAHVLAKRSEDRWRNLYFCKRHLP